MSAPVIKNELRARILWLHHQEWQPWEIAQETGLPQTVIGALLDDFGESEPASVGEQTSVPIVNGAVRPDGPAATAHAPQTAPQTASDEPLTDLGAARRMVAAHGAHIRHVGAWGHWLVWDGRRWRVDDNAAAVARMAKGIARELFEQVATETDSQHRRELFRAAVRAESAAGIRAMIELASTELGVAVTPDVFDADPFLLNTTTGVLDLRTGQVLPHDPALHLTKITGAGYRADADSRTFDTFLGTIQPDKEMRAYLSRLLGYALLGAVREHVLPVFHGVGANGKSTLLSAVISALGDYATTADPGLLIDRGDVHPTGLADLHGRRFVVCHETDDGRRLAEATVKRLTGGDPIKARRMREDFWEFSPAHLIVMVTNHRPLVRGNDAGIWRRLRLVPFNVSIPPEKQDAELTDRLIADADGILAWLVAGHRQWRQQGLADPEQVLTATRDYRTDSDVFGTFLEFRCVTDNPYLSASATELFDAWKRYCAVENVDAGSQTAFGRRLAERGYEKSRQAGSGRAVWRGIGLATDEDTEP